MFQRLSAIGYVMDNKVILHNTAIVTKQDNALVLNTGGWFTPTTKKYMNKGSALFDIPFTVYQKNGKWFVDYNGLTYTFLGNTLTIPLT
jgi:hypothetical protein